VITHGTLRLPGRERSKSLHLGDGCRNRLLFARPHYLNFCSHRETVHKILSHIKRQPLLASLFNREHRLSRPDGFADFSNDHSYPTVGRSTHRRLVQSSLKNGKRRGGGGDLCIGDGKLFFGWSRRRSRMIRVGRSEVGARACDVVLSLIERLLW